MSFSILFCLKFSKRNQCWTPLSVCPYALVLKAVMRICGQTLASGEDSQHKVDVNHPHTTRGRSNHMSSTWTYNKFNITSYFYAPLMSHWNGGGGCYPAVPEYTRRSLAIICYAFTAALVTAGWLKWGDRQGGGGLQQCTVTEQTAWPTDLQTAEGRSSVTFTLLHWSRVKSWLKWTMIFLFIVFNIFVLSFFNRYYIRITKEFEIKSLQKLLTQSWSFTEFVLHLWSVDAV